MPRIPGPEHIRAAGTQEGPDLAECSGQGVSLREEMHGVLGPGELRNPLAIDPLLTQQECRRVAFEAGEHLLVEAGTGVGKSFAYLIPAIDRVTREGGRVVISTHTIALQEQLVDKDIPFLRTVFPQEFSAVLVKGRSNYLGLRRWRVGLGVISGSLGAAFSTNGPPVILHVAAHSEWDADRQKVTLTLFFLLSSLITVTAHGLGGLITWEVLQWLFWSAPFLALGTLAGIFLYHRLGDRDYKRITFMLILVTGVVLMGRSVAGG